MRKFFYGLAMALIGLVILLLGSVTVFAMMTPGVPLRLSDVLGFGAIFITPLAFVAFLARPKHYSVKEMAR